MNKTYTITAEGFIEGAFREKGEKLSLSDRQAKYLLLSGVIELPKQEDKSKPKADD